MNRTININTQLTFQNTNSQTRKNRRKFGTFNTPRRFTRVPIRNTHPSDNNHHCASTVTFRRIFLIHETPTEATESRISGQEPLSTAIFAQRILTAPRTIPHWLPTRPKVPYLLPPYATPYEHMQITWGINQFRCVYKQFRFKWANASVTLLSSPRSRSRCEISGENFSREWKPFAISLTTG